MRIVIVNYTSRKIGGVESYLQAVLPVFAHRGHTLGFWAETDVPAHRPPIAVPEGTQLWSAVRGRAGLAKALRDLQDWRPEILYVHKVDSPRTEERLLEIAPAVFFSHDYHATCISGNKSFSFPIARPCHRRFGLACFACYYPRRCGGLSPITMVRLYWRHSRRLELMRRYRAVLVASEHMAIEYGRHGIAAEVIVHTHKGADTSVIAHGKEAPRDILRLVFLGRLEKLKGVALLLQALPLLAERLRMRVECEIAGQGTDEQRLKSIARRVLKSHPSVAVNFHGWLAPAQCQALLDRCHLMVMPSVWPEPFGGVGSLAGELKVPAVAFDVGGISQWLRDGVNGVLAPGDPPSAAGLAEAIAIAAENPARYHQLCEGAYRYSRTASMDEHVKLVESRLSAAQKGKEFSVGDFARP